MKVWMSAVMVAGGMIMGTLAGCTDPIVPNQDKFADTPQVTLTGYILKSRMEVNVLPPTRTGAGQLRVVVQVRNLWSDPLSVDYQGWFIDERGAMVDNPVSWQHLTVAPKMTQQIELVSMSALARDFRVQIRPAE